MDTSHLTLLKNLCDEAGLGLTQRQLEAFNIFGDLLIERGRHVNLTSILDEREIIVKHFWDSLTAAVHVKELTLAIAAAADISSPDTDAFHSDSDAIGSDSDAVGSDSDAVGSAAGAVGSDSGVCGGANKIRLADAGAGAGFPGIPLKILYGDALAVTFIDSTRKKVDFINDAVRILGLSDCAAVHARLEDCARGAGFRGAFGFVTARALAPLPKLLGYCAPLLGRGGILVAMKGRRETADAETAQAGAQFAQSGCRLLRTAGLNLPGGGERTLIVIRKS